MLRTDGVEIRISYGDTLDITFDVKGYDVMQGDITVFSVKHDLQAPNMLLQQETECTVEGVAMVHVPSEAMSELPPGKYVYDIFLKRETEDDTEIQTVTPPSPLFIDGVVHCEN